MGKFKLEMDIDNEAFGDNPEYEIARILEHISKRIIYDTEGLLIDSNGNKVGTFELSEVD